jgi:hypothetical protein
LNAFKPSSRLLIVNITKAIAAAAAADYYLLHAVPRYCSRLASFNLRAQ